MGDTEMTMSQRPFMIYKFALLGVVCCLFGLGCVPLVRQEDDLEKYQTGGDEGEAGLLDIKNRKTSGIEEGDTVLFYHDGSKLIQKASNRIEVVYTQTRWVEWQEVPEKKEPRLEIRKSIRAGYRGSAGIAYDADLGSSMHEIDRLEIDVGSLRPGETVDAKIEYQVINRGNVPVKDFLIVDKLPPGIQVAPDAIFHTNYRTEWEVDKDHRVVIRVQKEIGPGRVNFFWFILYVTLVRPTPGGSSK